MISGMLFTRCPNCETTFRITETALQKADGQVRCGRCAHIFDAYRELRGRDDESTEPAPEAAPSGDGASAIRADAAGAAERDAIGRETETETETDSGGGGGGDGDGDRIGDGDDDGDGEAAAELESAGTTADVRDIPATESEPGSEDDLAGDEPGALADESSAAGKSSAAGDDDAEGKDPADLTADEIEAVLEELSTATRTEPEWMREPDAAAAAGRPRVWRAAAALAAVALGLQFTNHYRAELAGAPVIGGALQAVYGLAGIDLKPRWNVSQYELIDWKALAEPGANGQGNLVIESRVRNKGPDAQPYPFIHLRLLDRWEETVGSRVFTPDEYLTTPPSGAGLMAAGATTDAELIIVDPGPDAYGFELDVCVDLGEAYDCAADDVFD